MAGHEEAQIQVIPADKAKIKKIWVTAGLLAIITAIEFLIAFTVPADNDFGKYTRIIVFILLTIVKAYYIVSEFMHLGHEQKSLVYSIILPVMFLCWLILALLMEANFIANDLRYFWSMFL